MGELLLRGDRMVINVGKENATIETASALPEVVERSLEDISLETPNKYKDYLAPISTLQTNLDEVFKGLDDISKDMGELFDKADGLEKQSHDIEDKLHSFTELHNTVQHSFDAIYKTHTEMQNRMAYTDQALSDYIAVFRLRLMLAIGLGGLSLVLTILFKLL